MAKKPAPDSLSKAGRELWDQIVATYTLRDDELRTLEDACAATDMVHALTLAWKEDGYPLTTKGSMGQLVEHPLIGSIDKQRKMRNALFRQLKLPDIPSSGAPAVNQHRAAAQSKWAAAHGAS